MSSNFHALMLIKHSTSDTHQGNTDETAEQNLPVLKKNTLQSVEIHLFHRKCGSQSWQRLERAGTEFNIVLPTKIDLEDEES